MKIKLNRKTILQKFKDLDQNYKIDTIYCEVIKLKKRIQLLNEFQNMKLTEFISKQVTDSTKSCWSKHNKLKNDMTNLVKKHTRIKDGLTWQSKATEILKEKLYKLGVNETKLNKELEEAHNKFRNSLSKPQASSRSDNNDFIKECKDKKCKHYDEDYDGNCSLDTNFACPFGHSFIKS